MNRTKSIFRCALAFCILHSAFCIPLGAHALEITASATAVGAGELTPVSATVTGGTVDNLLLVYRATTSGLQKTWNTNAMTGAASPYAGYLPPLPAGTVVEWYVTDGTDSSATTTTTLAATPDYNRYHDGVQVANSQYGWQQVSGSNYVAQTPNGGQWKANGVGIGTTQRNLGGAIDTSIGMAYPTLYFQNLAQSEDPYICSPKLIGGVGTIDFRTILLGTTVKTSELTLQVAYTENDPTDNDWTDVAVYKYGTQHGAASSSGFPRICHVVLNDSNITYVRILRTQPNIYYISNIASARLAVDNICITKPPADVGIIEKLKNPGYPAADQNILMRCAVTNVVEETPAINRRVSVKYKYVARDSDDPSNGAAPWLSADMAYRGKDGEGLDWYEGTIPTQKVGYVWYYYQVDYDGYHYGENPLTGTSESISPAYWDDGDVTTHDRPEAGARFQVRPFRSRYSRIALAATPGEASVSEMSLVGDEQWQAIVGVDGLTVVSNYFVGYGYYEDDAATYEAEPVMWGENNQDALSDPTLAGFLESSHDTTVTNRLIALNEKDYKGFYLYRFSSNDKDEAAAQTADGDRRYDYIVKKAVYQDFDDWTASPDYYESSLGGLPTITYTENFDGNAASAQSGATCVTEPWFEDTYGNFSVDASGNIHAADSYKVEQFQDEEVSDNFKATDQVTEYGFIRSGSRILADRKPNNNAQQRVNLALALNLYGQIENTSASIPYGLEKITFKARASVDDSNFAVYRGGTAWTLPQYVTATWELTEKADSKPYLSYLFLYQPSDPFGDYGPSWYEVRLVQTDSLDANNNSVSVQLWRRDSSATESVPVNTAATVRGYDLKVSRPVAVYAYSNSGKFTAKVSFTGNTSYQATVADPVARAALLNAGGTIGFGVYDAVPNITAVKVGTTSGGNNLLSSLGDTYSQWAYGGKRADGQKRWSITSSAITRTVDAQTIGLYAANCVGGEERAKMSELSSTPTTNITVNSFQMQSFTIPFKAWNKKFVQIRYDEGDGGVVLDDLVYYPWRAVTRYNETDAEDENGVSYLDWTSSDADDEPHKQENDWLDMGLGNSDNVRNHWVVMEGWTVRSGAFAIGANFDRSRANTNLYQFVVSPVLENGIGSLSFSYAVSSGKVVYGVERTSKNNYRNWTPVAVYTNVAGQSGERYVKIGENFGGENKGGRIRVRIYGPQDVGGLLGKNPDCGYDPDWGWTDGNAKILVDNLRAKDYPEDVNDNAWNAYNLRITDNAALAEAGLIYNNSGKSCFFNNSETNGVYGAEVFNEDEPYLESPPLRGVGVGEIAFQYRLVPETGDGPGCLVVRIAPERDTPVAQWKTITNLVVSADGTAFVKFDNEKIFDENNFVVRFYNSKLPGTPRIVIDNVLVTAPARASFEFEYVKLLPVQPLAGTNTAVEAKIMREIMNPKNVRIYCSYHKYDTNDVNDVWGVANWFNPLTSPKVELASVGEKVYRTREGAGIPDVFAVDDIVEFVVWGVHDAIDLNAGDTPIRQDPETFENPEWYKTLDLEENKVVAVDLNADHQADGWSPYFWVYSCAPRTFFVNEINNWFSANPIGDRNPPEFVELAGQAGTEIGGWRLMALPVSGDRFEYVIPAATRLRNDTGTGWGFFVWGDAWLAASNVVTHLDAAFPNSSEPSDKNLFYHGGILAFRSNGMIEQAISYGEESYVSGDYWVNAGRKVYRNPNSLSLISKIEDDEPVAGLSVDDFTWGQAEVTAGAGNGDSQIFADLGGDTPIVVVLKDPDGNEITDANVLAWIESFNEGRPTADIQTDIDELSMDEFNKDFLLNLDLTKECVAELKIASVRIEDGVVYLGVQLTRTENNVAVGTRKINGVLKLLGTADLAAGTFEPLQPDNFDSNFETGNAIGIEYELPASNPPAFFKVVIE